MLSGTRLVGSERGRRRQSRLLQAWRRVTLSARAATHVDGSTLVQKSVSWRQNRYRTAASATTCFKGAFIWSRK